MPKALTLLEMVLALTVIAVIFSTMLPQFNTIQKSWASRRGVAEAIQNGRVLTDHMNRNLTKADRIIAVSDPGDSSGFIVFEDNSGDRLRYYVGADGFVEYGPI